MAMETPRVVFVCRHDVDEKAIVAFIEARDRPPQGITLGVA